MKVVYKEGKFIDFCGRERQFVIAAVSIKIDGSVAENDPNDDTIWGEDLFNEDCYKVVSLGFAICHPDDKFDARVGKQVAFSKALNSRKYALYSTHKGLINATMINALLEQEAKFFVKDPGYYVKGYREDEKKTEELRSMVEYMSALSEEELMVFNYLHDNIDKKEVKELVHKACGGNI